MLNPRTPPDDDIDNPLGMYTPASRHTHNLDAVIFSSYQSPPLILLKPVNRRLCRFMRVVCVRIIHKAIKSHFMLPIRRPARVRRSLGCLHSSWPWKRDATVRLCVDDDDDDNDDDGD